MFVSNTKKNILSTDFNKSLFNGRVLKYFNYFKKSSNLFIPNKTQSIFFNNLQVKYYYFPDSRAINITIKMKMMLIN